MNFNLTFAVLAVAVGMAVPAHAQWLTYPTAGIPRTPDGKPRMDAPAPRGLDGKPDLSGLWGAEKTRPCPPDGCDDMQISEQFLNIGWRQADGKNQTLRFSLEDFAAQWDAVAAK